MRDHITQLSYLIAAVLFILGLRSLTRPDKARQGMQMAAVGSHKLRRKQRIDREPMLSDEEADTAAERDAADADGTGVAEPDDESMFGSRLGDLECSRACFDPRGACNGIDLDLRHVAQVEDHAAVRRAMTGDTVAAAAHGELMIAVACHGHDTLDVGDVGDADDRGGPFVDPAVEDGAGAVVPGVLRPDDGAAQGGEGA